MLPHRPRLLPAIIAALMSTPLCAGTLQLGLRAGYDDNINLAGTTADRHGSPVSRLRAAWHATSPHTRPRLTLSVGADAVAVTRASGLSAAAADLEVGTLWRAGRSFSAPTLGLLIAAGHREFDSDSRDADWARARAAAHVQWTTRVAAHGSVYAQMQRAADDVFDHDRIGAEAGLDWRPDPLRVLYVDMGISHGDATISATPPYGGASYSSRIAPDDVFTGQNAYRLDARAVTATLGYQQRLTATLSLLARLQRTDTRADGGSRYASNVAEIGLRAVWR